MTMLMVCGVYYGDLDVCTYIYNIHSFIQQESVKKEISKIDGI